jgi:hypothetical protein
MIDFTRAKKLFEQMKMKSTGRGFHMSMDQEAILETWTEMGRILKDDYIDNALTSEKEAIMPLILDSQANPGKYNLWVFFKSEGKDGEFVVILVHDFIGKDLSDLLSMMNQTTMSQLVHGVSYQIEFLTQKESSCILTGNDSGISFSMSLMTQ